MAAHFFQTTEGEWRSERRYYTLKSGEVQEVVSDLKIQFLAAKSDELLALAERHQLADRASLVCGAQVSWESDYVGAGRKPVIGSTVFGVRGDVLYRDRGFATPEPVTAQYAFPSPTAMTLRTAYKGSSFEEEIKLIGQRYRTRQTVIRRAGQEIMIGQYLETRQLP